MDSTSRSRKRSVRDFFTIFESSDNQEEYRIVQKNGDATVKLINQPSSKKLFYPNVFISIVELDSFWICLIFLSCFLMSWFSFALLYFVASEAHGDFQSSTDSDPAYSPCIQDVGDFVEMFQFSMETQTTIGYGTRYVTDECPVSIILVIIQSIIGALILSAMTGVVLFKFQSPKKRAHTVLFSKVACVYEEDGKYYIEIQILNMQRSQLIDTVVKALCIMNREDGSGKCRLDMEFSPYHENSRLIFRPKVYRHLVDKNSPFWDFDRRDFEKGAYEIVVTIDGVDEFTDNFVQGRTSFLPSEIEWGRHFKQMTATKTGRTFKLNFNDFTRTNRSSDMTDDSASAANSRRTSSEFGSTTMLQSETTFIIGSSSVCD
ncbi:Inward rectifier potassium channel [Mactra antiquata]